MKLQAASIRPGDGKLIILLQFGHNKFVSIPLEKGMHHLEVQDKLAKKIDEISVITGEISTPAFANHIKSAEVSIEEILYVLIHAVGDSRQCPKCFHSFVPNDRTQQEAWDLYKRIKGDK